MAIIRPSFIDAMSWEMAEVYGAITDQILINLASYFPYWKSSNVPKSAFEYQAKMLAQMGQVNKDTIKIIRQGLKGADKALSGCLEQAIIEAVKKSEPGLLKGVKEGILKPAGIPVVSPNQTRAFQLYYQQAASKLNLVNTVMLESTKQAYQATVSDIVARVQATQTALDIGTGEVVTGVSSWNQALRHSINRMKENGITGFIDHAGHRWSAEAYTAMDIRTTVANTARAAVWETNQDFGNDLYQVSYHDGARPLCYPWQNKIISANDRSGVTYDLDGNEIEIIPQSRTSYGEPAGLFGINCKHYPTPFIPGVSLIRGEPQDPEENARTYAESQQQRALERKIREEKRDLLMMKAQGASPDEIKAQRAKIRETDDEIDAFCDQTGRARRQSREGAYTTRSFPDPDTYDVDEFKKGQQKVIQAFYQTGGEQRGYTFGEMTPNEPITPAPKPVAPVTPVAPAQPQPLANYGKPFDDMLGYKKPQIAQFESAKEALTNSPEETRKAWEKVADKLKKPSVGVPGTKGAFYSPYDKRTNFQSFRKAFEDSGYQRKNVCFFHEFGHNIDDLLGTGQRGGYLSLTYVSPEGKLFSQVLEKEIGDTIGKFYLHKNGLADAYDAVKLAQDGQGGMGFVSFMRQMLKGVMPRDEWNGVRDALYGDGVGDSVLRPLADKWLKPHLERELRDIIKGKKDLATEFCDWVKSRFTEYEVTDVSDIFGNYMTRTFGSKFAYPFGVGHKASYQMVASNMPVEAFAEFYSATVTGCDSMVGIKEFLPESYKFFLEMLRSATQ